MPRYYPVFLDLAGKPCVVVGGGAVAWRKAKALVDCGAHVTVISPKTVPLLKHLAQQRRLRWVRRRFHLRDVQGAFVVVVATDDQVVNHRVFCEARRWHRLVNVVDQPALCSFIVPSVVRRGALTIAISTSGVSPALSRWMRLDMTARYGPWVSRVLSRMRRWRRQVHRGQADPRMRKRRLEALLRHELTRAGIRS